MSSQTPCDTNAGSADITRRSSINANIDSSFRNNPATRGSLTPAELDAIHQTNSFKQAQKLQKTDNHDLVKKLKNLEHNNESNT